MKGVKEGMNDDTRRYIGVIFAILFAMLAAGCIDKSEEVSKIEPKLKVVMKKVEELPTNGSVESAMSPDYAYRWTVIITNAGDEPVENVTVRWIFKEKGYTIKVWDAYRPLNVQRKLFEACPINDFVAKPPDKPITSGFRPRHNNGMAVDITLVDKYGNELEMPSGFDDFSEKARFSSKAMTKEARRNVDYLHEVMLSVGFKAYDAEWWHFVDAIEEPTPYLDIPLEMFLE